MLLNLVTFDLDLDLASQINYSVDLRRNLCTSLLYFVLRVRCRPKNVHVRYLIS